MINLFRKIYLWLWVALAFFLPFQTRYIVHLGIRESETMALYGIDLIIALILICSVFLYKKNWCLAVGWVILLWLFVANGMNIHFYWWLRIAETLTLVFLAYEERATLKVSIISGFIVGMMLSSLFGMVQVATQKLPANKWLGMAEQLPWQPGAVVLETTAGRLLRGYGTLPHPNIFGGLAAVALLVFLNSKEILPRFFRSRYSTIAIVFILLGGLWSSFSRSAWLALVGGVAVLLYQKKISKQLVWGMAIVAIALNGLWYQFSFDRLLVNNRLEQQSLNERAAVFKIAQTIIRNSPWLGVGVGNFTGAAAEILKNNDPRYIAPVHNMYLLILSEVGLVGLFVFLMVAIWLFRCMSPWAYPIMVAILIIGFFDHYWWTIFSARLILALLIALSLEQPARAHLD